VNEFLLGAGFSAERLANLIAMVIAAAIILWAASIVVGSLLGFTAKTLEGRQVLTYSLRGALVVILTLWLLA
jgi:hypothetical protein